MSTCTALQASLLSKLRQGLWAWGIPHKRRLDGKHDEKILWNCCEYDASYGMGPGFKTDTFCQVIALAQAFVGHESIFQELVRHQADELVFLFTLSRQHGCIIQWT